MQKIQLLFLIIINLFLFGCANNPDKLGISSLEWSSYSEVKQKNLLADYDRFIRERASMMKEQASQDSDKVFLHVSIYSGKIMFPPEFINWQKYMPVQFTIVNGQCSDIEMMHQFDKELKTELGVCFYGNTLYLDPSRYDITKKVGSVSIHSSPLWLTGFAYKGINSGGYVRLNNVTIEIEQGARLSSQNASHSETLKLVD